MTASRLSAGWIWTAAFSDRWMKEGSKNRWPLCLCPQRRAQHAETRPPGVEKRGNGHGISSLGRMENINCSAAAASNGRLTGEWPRSGCLGKQCDEFGNWSLSPSLRSVLGDQCGQARLDRVRLSTIPAKPSAHALPVVDLQRLVHGARCNHGRTPSCQSIARAGMSLFVTACIHGR